MAVSQAETGGSVSCIFSCVASQHGKYAHLRLSADEWDEKWSLKKNTTLISEPTRYTSRSSPGSRSRY